MRSNGKRRRGFRALFVITALLAGAFAYWAFDRYSAFADAPLSGLEHGESITVKRGDSFSTVLTRLRAAGVREGQRVEWQALARQLGAAGRLQVGEYALEPGMTPRVLLTRMRDGRVISYRLTILPGRTFRDLRATLANADALRHDATQLDDRAMMRALGHSGQHPEGRFLPETYAYTRGESELQVLARAYAAMDQALDAAWSGRDPGGALKNRDEMLVLASIVEKETGVASERPQIAGLFVRRLRLGMKLETDPTVIYGIGPKYDGNIRRKDLLADTPYNTYLHAGLPPTPIAMPSADALEAVAHPAPGDALFFVAVGDGSGRHLFARTYAEHLRNYQVYIANYRKGLQARGNAAAREPK